MAESSGIPTPVLTSGPTSTSSEIQPEVPMNTSSTGTREPTQSVPAQASTDPKLSFFSRYKLFPYNSVALGRLVNNTDEPWQDFCRVSLNLADNDIAMSYYPRLRETLESAKGTSLYNKICRVFFRPDNAEEFPSVLEKTYLLYNSGEHFKTLAGDEKARERFERNIKYGCIVYMIVGIHKVDESSIRTGELERRFAELNANVGTENDRVAIGSPAPGEVVFAVQY